jgi:predicted nuclease with TOPRIM domain
MLDELITYIQGPLGAILGGLGVAIYNGRNRRTEAEIVDGTALRQELWKEIENLRARIDAMQEDLDKTRQSYLELLEKHVTLKTQHDRLKFDHDELLAKFASVNPVTP